MFKITEAQKVALRKVYLRMKAFDTPTDLTYLQFRRGVRNCGDYIMVQFGSMYLGIEKDGYTHS